MGPGSGKNGGEITFEGTYNELLSSNTSTGNALRQDRYYKNGSLHEYSLLNYVCDVMRYLSKYLKRVIHLFKYFDR
jgi:hypothetical protein